MENSLAIAITRIVVPISVENSDVIDESVCPMPENRRIELLNSTKNADYSNWWIDSPGVREAEDRFDWTQKQQGIILGAFFWGYGISHLPGAMLAQKFGGKAVLLICIFMAALLALLTPTVVVYGRSGLFEDGSISFDTLSAISGGANALIAIRVVMGLFAGPSFPALSSLFSAWFSLKERAFLGALVYSGIAVSIFSVLGLRLV